MDPAMYSNWAISIAQGDIIGKEIFPAMPLYPYFLGFLYFLTNFSIFNARLIQFLLGSFSAFLVYFLAREIFGKRPAAISGVIAALYAPFIFYEGMFVPAALVMFLFLLSALILVLIKDDLKAKNWFIFGILAGLTALANASMLIVLIILPLLFLKKDLKKLLFLYAAVILIIGCVAARNYYVGKDLVLITSQGGVNFYIGNNPGATGRFSSITDSIQGSKDLIQDTRILAEKNKGGKLKPSEISAFWTKKALGFITRHPVKYSKLVLNKFYIFWDGFEYPDVEDYYFAKKFTPVLRLPLFVFWFVAPFALCGIIFSLKYWRKALVLYIFLGASIIGILLMFVNSRYRIAAMPFIIIFCGFAVSYFWESLTSRGFKKAALFLLVLIASFVFVNLDAQKPDYALAYYNLSALYFNRGEYDNAITAARQAIDIVPSALLPRHILGMAYFYKKDDKEALRQLNAALEIEPSFAPALSFLGEIYLSKNDFNKARAVLERAVSADPDDFTSRILLGNVYYNEGEIQKAAQQYREALRIQPDNKFAIERLKKSRNEK